MAFERTISLHSPPAAADVPLSVASPPGLASILIPCCGMLEYTKLLVPSLLRHTRQPYELIFLDIGSLDGTSEYLAGLKAGSQIPVEVVWTQTDLGIGQAVKDAVARARGEFVVLLNNDTIVTPHWLEQLVALVTMSPTIGMVGPMSNYAPAGQLVETVPYRVGPRKAAKPGEAMVDVDAIVRFAAEHGEKNKGKWLQLDRLGGFCLLVKRHALELIGRRLEPWTDLGLFDTDILSAKVHEVGMTVACCRDLFIHHFGTRTFAAGAPKEQLKG